MGSVGLRQGVLRSQQTSLEEEAELGGPRVVERLADKEDEEVAGDPPRKGEVLPERRHCRILTISVKW